VPQYDADWNAGEGVVQKVGGGLVDLAIRLVVPRQLGAENAVPWQAAVLGYVGHQGHIAIGHRSNDEPMLQAIQTWHRIGPRSQVMPGQIELCLGGFAETGNIEFSEHFLQCHTVQPVQVGPGEGTVTHFVHEGPILSAPGVGKSVPVGRHSMDSAKLLGVLDDATAPVDHCAEHIKDQCLHLSDVHHQERALAKISGDPEVLEGANRGTQHMYFTNPIKKFESRSSGLMSTHPPIIDRVNRLRQLTGEAPLAAADEAQLAGLE